MQIFPRLFVFTQVVVNHMSCNENHCIRKEHETEAFSLETPLRAFKIKMMVIKYKSGHMRATL